MFSMRLNTLINSLVESNFPTDESKQNKALHLSFDLRLSDFNDGRDVTKSYFLNLLYYAPPGDSYISVFSSITPGGGSGSYVGAKAKDVKDWRFETRHDSCWRNIQAIDRVFNMAHDALYFLRQEQGLTELLAKDFVQYVDFALFGRGKMFEWVNIEVTADPNDLARHKRKVKVL